jgi:glycerol-3-phosphate acyltransferase PlsY
MDIFKTVLLSVAAFGLGAVPFALLVGRLFLDKDIRSYGDGNPGAFNVFKAGGQKSGYLAVALDVGKGVPFVFLAHALYGLPGPALVIVAVSAVLGHACSPFLGWRGGKAVAVTFGVLLAMPEREMLLALIAFTVLGFLFIEEDAWTVVFGAAAAFAYTAVTRGSTWETALMICLLVILTVKQLEALHTFPGLRGRLVRWLQAVVHTTLSII